jgi:vancomycin resistance protein YoaR
LALQKQLPEKSKEPVVITSQGKAWTVAPEDLGLTFDYPVLASQAMGVGRSAGFFGDIGQRFGAWFGSAKLPARATAENAKLAAIIGEIAGELDVPPVDAGVMLKGTSASVTAATSGKMVDRVQLTTSLLTAFTSAERKIEAPVRVVEADVSDAAAQAAMTSVQAMLTEPATVTWGAKSWKFSAKDLAAMIEFRKARSSDGTSWTLNPYASEKETSNTVAPKLGLKIGRPARDAKFRTRSGTVTIVPAQTGVGPDFEALAAGITAAMKGPAGQPRTVALRTRKTQPKVTTAMAREMNIKERISRFATTYSSGNRPRVNNIHLLGDSLDGKLVKPGATFSFNGAIGERTAAKGYKEANAIVDGKLVPQLGGGICQVGTTLFNTVFLSGLPVVERHNHSFYISHYPKGRDATVSWGGPDLKFKNSTDSWLLISVSYTNSSITISLYGVDPGYDVTSKVSPFSNERPFPTEKTKDPKLAEGVKVIDDAGLTGRTCTVTRTVKKDGEVVRADIFKSVYRPKVEIVRVGTKAPSSKPATDKAGSKN